jgi:hypothetical protein
MAVMGRSLSRASLLGAALTVVLLAGGTAAAAPAAFTAGPVPSAGARTVSALGSRPPAQDNLSGISCVSSSFCMAVGGYSGRSLAEEWNGSRWRVVLSATGRGLSDVSCTSVTFCMAIGSPAQVWNGRTWRAVTFGFGSPRLSCASATFCIAVGPGAESSESNISERWNGRTWRKLTTPDIGCIPFCGLTGVSCVSARNCLAVGFSADNSGNTEVGTGLAWNGKAWHDASPPTPGFAFLSGVSCASAVSCLVVGGYETNGPGPCLSTFCILAMAWDGSAWRQLATPAVGPSLSSVSCASTGGCAAVSGTLASAWDGSTWRQLTIAAPGETGNSLSEVSCWHASACMAVGEYTTIAGADLTLAEEWNGSTWQVRRTPSPDDAANGLNAVSCRRSGACMAVGSYLNASDVQVTLAEQWDGKAWRVRPTPSPGAQVSALSGISCPTATRCVAVGYYDTAGGQQALAEEWNGATWQLLTTPSPAASASELSAVSCPIGASCIAVGSSLMPSGVRLTLAEEWDGSTWQVQTSPSPGASGNELSAVSCPSGASCIAVGDFGSRLPRYPLAEAWNGTAWRVLASPAIGGPGELTSVACSRPSTCMAVGDYFRKFTHSPLRTLAEAWNGTSWQILPTPRSAGRRSGHLAAVSCTRPGRCRAVGGFTSQSGNAVVLAEAWNGASWRLMRIAGPSSEFSDFYGISCTLASRCIAAGETDPQRTLAERWDGARWRLLKTPS